MKYRVSIPQPCHKDWNQMTPTERGKFCAACQKEVLDFTHLTDKELVQRLDTGKKMCGRFRQNQLNVDYHSMENTSFPLKKWWLSAASVLSLGIVGQAQVVQDSAQIEQTEVRVNSIQEKDSVFIIKGKVIDDFGPLTAASITNLRTGQKIESDEKGNFVIQALPYDEIQVLHPNTLFENIFYAINLNKNRQYIEAGDQLSIGIIIIACKPNLWQRFTNIFRSKENRKCSTKNH